MLMSYKMNDAAWAFAHAQSTLNELQGVLWSIMAV